MKYPVPDFSGTLKALSGILAKAEAHCVDNKIDPDELLKAQLYPDMFNLIRNVQTSCDTAKGAAARLTGRENPSFEDNETSFADLQARIAKTREFIHSVPEEDFEGADERKVVLKTGNGDLPFVGADYLARFAYPNFYFHVTLCHAILRHKGVAIGKRDYLGAV